MGETGYRTVDVEVNGGPLRVGVWGKGGPVVLGIHGITASHISWSATVAALGNEVTLVAPDLRGRGASAGLGGPYGMAAHASDCVAALDHLGVERAMLAGQSMGGYVATVMAGRYPDRVESIVLLDGGIPLPIPPGVDPDQLLEAILGPSIERLRTTFVSREAYLDYWRPHPAFAETGMWNMFIEEYLDYDLTGKEPELRSRVSEEAVQADSRDLLTNTQTREVFAEIKCPVHLIRCPKDTMNKPNPLIPDFSVEDVKQLCPQLTDEMAEEMNHYQLVMDERGAELVAARIKEMIRAGSLKQA
jgi:pimeloyl-ACP methyl ester carboxylesterase